MFPMQDQGGYFAEGQHVITKVKMNKGKPNYEGYEVVATNLVGCLRARS